MERLRHGCMITWVRELIMMNQVIVVRQCPTVLSNGTRLFSCGTNKEGDSYLVEWNESEGGVKQTYQGFRKRSVGVVEFDTTKNRFLVFGDEFVVKIWDMDNPSILTTIEGDGGLPVIFMWTYLLGLITIQGLRLAETQVA